MSHDYFWFNGSYYLQGQGGVTGAKFAQSMANLFMANWEEDVIYGRQRTELIFWGDI